MGPKVNPKLISKEKFAKMELKLTEWFLRRVFLHNAAFNP